MNNKYNVGKIIETEEVGTAKVVGIYQTIYGLSSLPVFLYALQHADCETITYHAENEITIRGL